MIDKLYKEVKVLKETSSMLDYENKTFKTKEGQYSISLDEMFHLQKLIKDISKHLESNSDPVLEKILMQLSEVKKIWGEFNHKVEKELHKKNASRPEDWSDYGINGPHDNRVQKTSRGTPPSGPGQWEE